MSNASIADQEPSKREVVEHTSPEAVSALTNAAAVDALAVSIRKALQQIDAELATKAWLLKDPERRKALSRSREFLQRIRAALEERRPGAPFNATQDLVDRLASDASRYGRENAWDFAEELRAASYAFLSDEALGVLLTKESADTTSISYGKVFGEPFPKDLLERNPFAREEALALLHRLHDERVDRVRHDRARDKLWQHFVLKLTPVVALLLGSCLYLDSTRQWPNLLPVLAGGLGSILSAVLKLRDGEQRIRHLRRSVSFLLLQPMIGATAALVLMWFGVGSVLRIDSSNTTATQLLGFLAGFSEPFFLGTIGRLTEMGSSQGKSPAENDGASMRKRPHG